MAANERPIAGSESRRYEIRVRGPVGPTMMQAFPTLAARRSGQDTLLVGSIPDQSALYGVIHELEALGLELLEIGRLPTSDRRATGQSRDELARIRDDAARRGIDFITLRGLAERLGIPGTGLADLQRHLRSTRKPDEYTPPPWNVRP